MPTKIKNQKNLLDYYGFTKTEQKKYPVVTGILKQLTPERIKKEIQEIQNIKLPPELQKWVKEYEKVGDRNEFIWKWMYKMFRIISFRLCFQEYNKPLEKIKFLITMFIVQIDDVAEEKHSASLLNEILKIPSKQDYIKFSQLNNSEKKYLKFTIELWNYIEKNIVKYPEYKELKDVFNYDIDQVFNAIRYSYIVNENPYLINKTEYWLYLPNNMVFLVYLILDLMCSFKSNLKKMGAFRELVCEVQKMGRIGNWLGTWEREIKDGDFTSGVFAYSIKNRILEHEEIRKGDKKQIIKKIKESNTEQYLLIKWGKFYKNIEKFAKDKKLINIEKLLKELEYLLLVDLAARGYK